MKDKKLIEQILEEVDYIGTDYIKVRNAVIIAARITKEAQAKEIKDIIKNDQEESPEMIVDRISAYLNGCKLAVLNEVEK